MDKLIKLAEYVLALESNSVTDEVRHDFASIIEDENSALENFALILTNVLKQVDNTLTAKEASDLIEHEYRNLPFAFYLDEFETYVPFIDLLLLTKVNAKEERFTLDSLKNYINIADSLANESIKMGIYNAILTMLLYGRSITEDMAFSHKVLNYVKNYKNFSDVERILSNIVLDVIRN